MVENESEAENESETEEQPALPLVESSLRLRGYEKAQLSSANSQAAGGSSSEQLMHRLNLSRSPEGWWAAGRWELLEELLAPRLAANRMQRDSSQAKQLVQQVMMMMHKCCFQEFGKV
jgi:hypothetical protein